MTPCTTCHVDLSAEWRGGQRQVFLLATGLAERAQRTLVITAPNSPLAQRLSKSGVEVHELTARGEWDIWAARKIIHIVNSAGAQIAAAHASHPHALLALARPWLNPKTKIVVHRRVDVVPHAGYFNRWKYQAADAYIAISDAVKSALVRVRTPAEKISVISSAVPLMEYRPEAKARLAHELNLDPQAPWVGNVADLAAHKGQVHLLRAWPQVLRSRPEARLVIIGDGPLREELTALGRRLAIDQSVFFTGRRNDITDWFSSFSAFVMTSVSEGLCTSILDAMTAKVPVVATAAGGIPELVRDKVTGFLAPIGDDRQIAEGLIKVLEGAEIVRACVENAYRMVTTERSVASMVDRTLELYRKLADDQK